MNGPDRNVRERVAREDMVMFINACFACSGQKEFYEDAQRQGVSIEFLHEYILGNYRRLYARCLAAGINHFNQALVIVNLLATGSSTPKSQREEEGMLIHAALRALPPQRAYRVFVELRARKINNRRTRAVVKSYLAERADLSFEAVKYRNKLRAAVIHAHLELPGEVGAFLFRGWKQRSFVTPLFERFRQAHFSKSAIYDLPYTVAAGLAERHAIDSAEFLTKIAPQMTVGEKLRLQTSAQREAIPLELEFGRVGLTRLGLYLLSLPAAERLKSRDSFQRAAAQAARRALRRSPQRLGKVAAVLDCSYSSSGSSEKRRRPLAIAWATSQLLRQAAAEYRAFWTPNVDDELAVEARGQTDLATPLLDALEWGAEFILIVSDGYENDPPRGAAEVARVFRERLDPNRSTSIVHLNPVFDAEHFAPHTIGPAIPSVGLRDAEDLLTMLGFARFADGSAPLSELEEYLAIRVEQLLRQSKSDASKVAAGTSEALE